MVFLTGAQWSGNIASPFSAALRTLFGAALFVARTVSEAQIL